MAPTDDHHPATTNPHPDDRSNTTLAERRPDAEPPLLDKTE
jgi:hypothetical protein